MIFISAPSNCFIEPYCNEHEQELFANKYLKSLCSVLRLLSMITGDVGLIGENKLL